MVSCWKQIDIFKGWFREDCQEVSWSKVGVIHWLLDSSIWGVPNSVSCYFKSSPLEVFLSSCKATLLKSHFRNECSPVNFLHIFFVIVFHEEMSTYFKNKDYIFILVLCSAPPDPIAYSVFIRLVRLARNDFKLFFFILSLSGVGVVGTV